MRLKKRSGLLVLLILLLTVSFAGAGTEKVIIGLGESTMMNGKNITFIGVLGEAASFKVDDRYGTIQKNDLGFIGGVYIHLTGLSKIPAIAILNVTINFVCGDASCDFDNGEGPGFCCTDCGCYPSSLSCLNNMCVENVTQPKAHYECQQDSDCVNVSGVETLCSAPSCDKTYVPYKCKSVKIIECLNDDSCCPKGCTKETDKDCEIVDMCKDASDCDDDNICTDDTCDGQPKACINQRIGSCVVNGECLTAGTSEGIRYCDISEKMMLKKDKGITCLNDYECFTKDCRIGRCATKLIDAAFFYIFLGAAIIASAITGVYFYLYSRREKED